MISATYMTCLRGRPKHYFPQGVFPFTALTQEAYLQWVFCILLLEPFRQSIQRPGFSAEGRQHFQAGELGSQI